MHPYAEETRELFGDKLGELENRAAPVAHKLGRVLSNTRAVKAFELDVDESDDDADDEAEVGLYIILSIILYYPVLSCLCGGLFISLCV